MQLPCAAVSEACTARDQTRDARGGRSLQGMVPFLSQLMLSKDLAAEATQATMASHQSHCADFDVLRGPQEQLTMTGFRSQMMSSTTTAMAKISRHGSFLLGR